MENEKEWKLAKKIYQTLKDKGALIGNASIHIIEKVLIVENETTQNIYNVDTEEVNSMWARVINDARWYDGTPQMLVQLIDHFKNLGYSIINQSNHP